MHLLELVDVLCREAHASREEVLADADRLVTLHEEEQSNALEAAAASYADFCRRTAAASDSLGLPGLATLAGALADGVSMAAALPVELRASAAPLLVAWPDFFVEYLQGWAGEAADPALIDSILSQVAAADFVTPLDEQQRADLRAALLDLPSLVVQQAAMTSPWQPLTDDALILAPADDAEPTMLEGLLADGPAMSQRLGDLVSRMLQGRASSDDLESAHRLAHTLKGNAAIAGIRGISTAAHALEDVLEAYRRADFVPPEALPSLLQEASDQLEFAFDHLLGGSMDMAAFAVCVRHLHAWACHLQGQVVPAELLQAGAGSAWSMDAPAEPAGLEPAGQSPVAAANRPGASAEDDTQIRVDASALDRIFRSVNELSIGMLRMRQQQDEMIARVEAMAALEQTALQRLLEIENRVSVEGLGRMTPVAGVGRLARSGDAPGDGSFDELELDRYNELAGAAQALGEAIHDLRSARLDLMPAMRETGALAQRQLGFARDAQHRTAQARLRPLTDLRARLKRTVRQTCAATGREAVLEILGDEARVDAAVLPPLADALLHLLRNGIDHGIEPPEERLVAGKSPAGRLVLQFGASGGGLVVRLTDDGRGLDLEAIFDKAVERGVVAPEARLSEDEIRRLIFLPGFSTRRAVSETSGRGVGLDVVTQAVASLQGSVSVTSTPGAGAEFRLFVLPTVGTIHALHVSVSGEHFLIPSVQLKGAVAAGGAQPEDGTPEDLGALLFGGASVVSAGALPAILVEVDGRRHILSVDRVLEAREFLYAPAPVMINRMPGVSGVATLADGSLAIMLDLAELLRRPVPLHAAGLRQLEAAASRRHPVLVVDDSASVRNTLGQLLRDTGYDVVTARDGLEAIRAVMERPFAAVLTDLEMPQVNGFELTEFIRLRSGQSSVPVIMLTSRGQQKHRARAVEVGVSSFLVKPYSDDQILGALSHATVAAGHPGESETVGLAHAHAGPLALGTET